ncbi:hypothetical protein, partial [Serratia marcescens]
GVFLFNRKSPPPLIFHLFWTLNLYCPIRFRRRRATVLARIKNLSSHWLPRGVFHFCVNSSLRTFIEEGMSGLSCGWCMKHADKPFLFGQMNESRNAVFLVFLK